MDEPAVSPASIRVVMLGPPGAGKGTQAERIAQQRGLPHVSTGDIFRDAVKKGTALGQEAKAYMSRGDLVPDRIVIGIVEERLKAKDAQDGFVLDGFPRTVQQAEALERALQTRGTGISRVLNLSVPAEEVVKRISGRRVCRQCGAMYHVTFGPPKKDGRCDRCQGELYQRDDDREETVTARLDVYARETDPLVAFYRDRGLLAEIDGVGRPDAVAGQIVEALDGAAR
jgi:adenylate kinase